MSRSRRRFWLWSVRASVFWVPRWKEKSHGRVDVRCGKCKVYVRGLWHVICASPSRPPPHRRRDLVALFTCCALRCAVITSRVQLPLSENTENGGCCVVSVKEGYWRSNDRKLHFDDKAKCDYRAWSARDFDDLLRVFSRRLRISRLMRDFIPIFMVRPHPLWSSRRRNIKRYIYMCMHVHMYVYLKSCSRCRYCRRRDRVGFTRRIQI